MKKVKSFIKNIPWGYKYLLIWVICNFFASIFYPLLKAYAEAERGYTGAFGGEIAVWFVGILAVLVADTIRIGREHNASEEDN